MHKSLKVDFTEFGKVDNKGHIRGKVQIGYAGKNVNGSEISKEAFESAAESLKNVPVVGNWLGSNFGGHDMILEERGNDIVVKDATTPFGVVPEDCNPRWETVEDEYGNTKEYFTCDVILWHERYPEQVEFVKEHGVNQSMEIMVTEGGFDEDWDYYQIEDFYFSALCLLGTDVGDGGQVDPAFEDSKVTAFKLDKNFKSKFEKAKQEESKEAKENMEFKEKYEELKEEFKAFQEDAEVQEEALVEEKASLEEEIKVLNSKIEELEQNLEEYEKAELKAEKENVVAEYSDLLDEESIKPIAEKIDELSVEELDFELAKAVTEKVKAKKAEFSKEEPKPEIKADAIKPKSFGVSGKYFI